MHVKSNDGSILVVIRLLRRRFHQSQISVSDWKGAQAAEAMVIEELFSDLDLVGIRGHRRPAQAAAVERAPGHAVSTIAIHRHLSLDDGFQIIANATRICRSGQGDTNSITGAPGRQRHQEAGSARGERKVLLSLFDY
jgi:hypothetical protein